MIDSQRDDDTFLCSSPVSVLPPSPSISPSSAAPSATVSGRGEIESAAAHVGIADNLVVQSHGEMIPSSKKGENSSNNHSESSFDGGASSSDTSSSTSSCSSSDSITLSSSDSIGDSSNVSSIANNGTRKQSPSAMFFWGGLDARIIGHEFVTSKKPHVLYTLEVDSGSRRWIVYRRYSDFDELHKKINATFPSRFIQELHLPPKRRFKMRKFDYEFMKQREEGLDKYIQLLLKNPVTLRSMQVHNFFSESFNKIDTNNNIYSDDEDDDDSSSGIFDQLGGFFSKMLRESPVKPSSPPVLRRIDFSRGKAPVHPRIVELRNEFDYEKKFEECGTPALLDTWFRKGLWSKNLQAVLDTLETTKKQVVQSRRFLQDYQRQRFGRSYSSPNLAAADIIEDPSPRKSSRRKPPLLEHRPYELDISTSPPSTSSSSNILSSTTSISTSVHFRNRTDTI